MIYLNNKFVAFSILILAICIMISGVLISNAINELSHQESLTLEEPKSVLMSKEEAAEYLGLDIVTFKAKLENDINIKFNLKSYPTYQYMPYMQLHGKKYFTREALDKWVQYQTR